jgi:hypothetical protein
VVRGLRQLHFSSSSVQQQEFMQRAESLLEHMTRIKEDSQPQQQQQHQQQLREQQVSPASSWSSEEEV